MQALSVRGAEHNRALDKQPGHTQLKDMLWNTMGADSNDIPESHDFDSEEKTY